MGNKSKTSPPCLNGIDCASGRPWTGRKKKKVYNNICDFKEFLVLLWCKKKNFLTFQIYNKGGGKT